MKRSPMVRTGFTRKLRKALQAGKVSYAERKWQKAVRERDNCTCQRCGKYDEHIHAHHVATRKRRPDLKLVVSNGICLCRDCHRWVHDHPIEATGLGFLSDETYEKARKEAA